MSELQRDNLLTSLAIVTIFMLLGLIILLQIYCIDSHPVLTIFLQLMSTLTAIFICYLLWVKAYNAKTLLLGDYFRDHDNEKIIEQYDTQLLDGQLSTQIIPRAILEQDSPRARDQLKRLKGSYFFPPRIIVNINVNNLLSRDDARQVMLIHNLNRVLHLLKHRGKRQKVDLIINDMQSLDGYKEFSQLFNKTMRFSVKSTLKIQFEALQDSSKALLEYPTDNFLSYLKFANSMPTCIEQIDMLLNNLMLTGYDSNSEVFFSNQ